MINTFPGLWSDISDSMENSVAFTNILTLTLSLPWSVLPALQFLISPVHSVDSGDHRIAKGELSQKVGGGLGLFNSGFPLAG